MAGESQAAAASDVALLDAWRAGDRAAGDRLIARHYDAVHRFFEVKAGFVADDLTQRTFLACVQQTAALRHAASFKAYLFAIARRQYLDHQRKAGRGDAAFDRFGAAEELPTSMSRRVARRQEQQLVLQAMALLPDDLLLALQLYYWEDLSTIEIADALEIPQSTVTSRLARARGRLQELLGRIARRPEHREATLVELDAWARSIAALPLSVNGPR
jgi:RNA polymerase sigma-70 factor (ECF subfamily)